MIEQYLAIYLRLSKGDLNTTDESNSIKNQRRMIQNYIINKEEFAGMKIMEFADDGYSGTNFDRPQIQRMLDMIRHNQIKCIIVKDLSRFGRNYIDVGDYLEKIFPVLDVRFISINDNFDSDHYVDDIPGMDIAFRNIMNYYMSGEQSFKVKKSIYAQRESGEHVGASAPYGYCKKQGCGNQLFIDSYAAGIVKRIFRLTLEGKGRMEIARILNIENELTPGDYKKSIRKDESRELFKREKEWTEASIVMILKNEAYIGTAISGRHYRPEMGKRYVKQAPREQWFILENAHEAIVSKEDFEKVQKNFRKKSDYKHFYEKSDDVLSGMLSCGHCKRALDKRNKDGGVFYYCDSHRIHPKYQCNTDYILSSDLEKVILRVVKSEIEAMAEFKSMIKKASFIEKVDAKNVVDKLIQTEDKGLYLKKQKIELYEQYKEVKKDIVRNYDFLNTFLQFGDFQKLSREILQVLVKRVFVYDKNCVKIVFRLRDEYKNFL